MPGAEPNRRPVFLSHDGAIDDFMALLLLAQSPEIELRGVSCVNGDCLAEPAMEVQAKLLSLAGRPGVEQSLSAARAYNPFPWKYRADCQRLLALEEMRALPGPVGRPPYPDGEAHLRRTLEACSRAELTVLVTGPLTPLTLVLERAPHLGERIREVIWMGGAIDRPGNLEPDSLGGATFGEAAEWNVFWDPFAADWFLRRTSVALTLFPLDVTDEARLDSEPFQLLDRAGSAGPCARLAAAAYRLTLDQPLYRLWDVTAACWLLQPDLFEPAEEVGLRVELWGRDQGATRRDPAGRAALAVMRFRQHGLPRLWRLVAERLGASRA